MRNIRTFSVILPGALPGHLSAPLRLSSLRPQKSRHRLLSLLGHCHARQHPPPPLHQVGFTLKIRFSLLIQDQLHPLPLSQRTPSTRVCLLCHAGHTRGTHAMLTRFISHTLCFSGTQSMRSPSLSSSWSLSSSSPSSMSPW